MTATGIHSSSGGGRALDRSRDARRGKPNPATVARAHGLFNVIGGLWPLVSRRSFEAVFGHKTEGWLQHTVGALLMSNGLVQLGAAGSVEGGRHARRLGLATAASLLAIDLVYVPVGRISRAYLGDAALELGWITAWLLTPRPAGPGGTRHGGEADRP